MNDSIVKLALGITLLYTTLFPIKNTLAGSDDQEVTLKIEDNLTELADHESYMYLDENVNINWNDIDMNDNVFPEGPSCIIDIY